MRGGLRKLAWVVGIPVVLLGLMKGGIHWYATQKVDQLILDAAPWVSITYENLDTSLAGRLDIHDIRMIPVGQLDSFSIGQISLQGPDAFTYLLKHNPVTGGESPPEYLEVVFRDLNLVLTRSLIRNLDDSYQIALQSTQGMSAACTEPGSISFSMLKDMGRNKLSGDGRLFYRYYANKQELRGSIELDVQGIQSFFMELTLGNLTPHAFEYGAPGMPWLNDMRLVMNVAPEFGKEVSAYCAEKTEKTAEEYQEFAAGMFLQNLANNGIELGQGLEQAVRYFYREWGEIDIALKPPTPLNILTLMLRAPEDMEQALGLEVAFNNQLLTDLSFNLKKNARLFVVDPEQDKKTVAPRPRYKMVWKRVTPALLSKYLDRAVRLHLTDRPVRQGVLVAVEGDTVYVEQRVDGGKFTAHVPSKNIYKAEARVRVRVNPPSTAEQAQAN